MWDPGLTGAGELTPHHFIAISEAQAGLQRLQVITPDPVPTTPRHNRHDVTPFWLPTVRFQLIPVRDRARKQDDDIGSAQCREKVYQYVEITGGARSVKKKK